MYRVVLYCLLALSGIGILLAFAGQNIFTFKGPQALVSFGVILTSCYVFNIILARLYKATPNLESSAITGLILFLILPPGTTTTRVFSLVLAAAIAIASKYLLVWKDRHIFNPAALAVVLTGLVGLISPSWWIDSKEMLPFLIVSGLIIAMKIRRLQLVFAFIAFTLIFVALRSILDNTDTFYLLKMAIISSPLIFFGTVMITEPSTTPYKYRQLIIYALFVSTYAFIFGNIGPLSSSPELTLVAANFLFVIFWFTPTYHLKLSEVKPLGSNIYEFIFIPDRKLVFKAGQYAEWTLPGVKLDSRGNRRTFTISSSPSQNKVRLIMKVFDQPSNFKKVIGNLKPGQKLQLSHIAGEFTLPDDKTKQLVFIAGGIGITPYLSIIQSLIDSKNSYDIVMFYSANSYDELVYLKYLQSLGASWLTVIPIISSPQSAPKNWEGNTGLITGEMIKNVPNYANRQYYLSGPPKMVDAYKQLLKTQKIPNRQITTDYFSGY